MPLNANCNIFKIAPGDLTEHSPLAVMGRAQLSPARCLEQILWAFLWERKNQTNKLFGLGKKVNSKVASFNSWAKSDSKTMDWNTPESPVDATNPTQFWSWGLIAIWQQSQGSCDSDVCSGFLFQAYLRKESKKCESRRATQAEL